MLNPTARAPVYPRPVPPLDPEPISLLPGENFYESSSDSDHKERDVKRRRIELCAERYLRGEGLYIMTAGLKGPFDDNGWKNPWRREKRSKREIELEIPETSYRGGFHVPVSLASPPARRAETKADPFSSDALRYELKSKAITSDASSDRRVVTSALHHSVHRISKSKPVENWLKTNKFHPRYPKGVECAKDASPTPVMSSKRRRRSCSGTPNMSGAQGSPTTKAVTRLSEDQNLKITPHLASASIRSIDTQRHRNVEGDMRNMFLHSDLQSESSTKPLHNRNSNAPLRSQFPERAEHAILNTKRKSLHTIPPSTHLSAFEYRRLRTGTEPRSDGQPGQEVKHNTTSEVIQQAELSPKGPQVGPLKDHLVQPAVTTVPAIEVDSGSLRDDRTATIPMPSTQLPAPSAEAETNGTDQLPSAQVVSVQPLLPSITTQSNGDKMLEEPSMSNVNGGTEENPIFPGCSEEANLVAEQIDVQGPLSYVPDRQHNRVSTPPQSYVAIRSSPQKGAKNSDTQQMFAALTPLGFGTIKKVPLKPEQQSEPSTVTPTKRNLPPKDCMKPKIPTKRAAFASELISFSPGSSQGSIKTNLKVSKGTKQVAGDSRKPHENAEPQHFGKFGLNMETSDDDGTPQERPKDKSKKSNSASDSLPSISSLFGAKEKSTRTLKSSLKSAPKSSNTETIHPSSNPFIIAQSSASRNRNGCAGSTASAIQQDAQIQPPYTPFAFGSELIGSDYGLSSIRPIVEDDPDFDLEGAINDLGSYLGTWDAEKEASGLVTAK